MHWLLGSCTRFRDSSVHKRKVYSTVFSSRLGSNDGAVTNAKVDQAKDLLGAIGYSGCAFVDDTLFPFWFLFLYLSSFYPRHSSFFFVFVAPSLWNWSTKDAETKNEEWKVVGWYSRSSKTSSTSTPFFRLFYSLVFQRLVRHLSAFALFSLGRSLSTWVSFDALGNEQGFPEARWPRTFDPGCWFHGKHGRRRTREERKSGQRKLTRSGFYFVFNGSNDVSF